MLVLRFPYLPPKNANPVPSMIRSRPWSQAIVDWFSSGPNKYTTLQKKMKYPNIEKKYTENTINKSSQIRRLISWHIAEMHLPGQCLSRLFYCRWLRISSLQPQAPSRWKIERWYGICRNKHSLNFNWSARQPRFRVLIDESNITAATSSIILCEASISMLQKEPEQPDANKNT